MTRPYTRRNQNVTTNVETVAPATTGETVTIGCKLPNGLHLDLHTPTGAKQRMADGSEFPIYGIERVTVRGGYSGAQPGVFSLPPGTAGLTPNVSKDFWEKWVKANASLPVVKNGLVFAAKDNSSARSIVAERATVRTGLEGLDKDTPAPGMKEVKRAASGFPEDEE